MKLIENVFRYSVAHIIEAKFVKKISDLAIIKPVSFFN